MELYIIVLVIIAIFLSKRKGKSFASSNLSDSKLYTRLSLLPVTQIILCCIVWFMTFLFFKMLSSKSPYLESAIEENLGVFSDIASDSYNDYRSGKLGPYIADAIKYHKWCIYLFFGLLASLIFQLYALKNKKCSKGIILFINSVLSLVLLAITYFIMYNCEMGGAKLVSVETLEFLSPREGNAIKNGINWTSFFFLALFVSHYYNYRWLNLYYEKAKEDNSGANKFKDCNAGEPSNSSTIEKLGELSQSGIPTNEGYDTSKGNVVQSDNTEDNGTKVYLLRQLKILFDAEILTSEEFANQKQDVLFSEAIPIWFPEKTKTEMLFELKKLLDENVLNQEEFDCQKKVILNTY